MSVQSMRLVTAVAMGLNSLLLRAFGQRESCAQCELKIEILILDRCSGRRRFYGQRSEVPGALRQTGIGGQSVVGDQRNNFSRRFPAEDSVRDDSLCQSCG